MKSANRTLRDYRRADRDYKAESERITEEFADEFDQCGRFDIPCPDPDYPDAPKVPSFKEPIKELRAVAAALSSLRAKLIGAQPPPELGPLNTQLLSAVEGLATVSQHNADVLSEAVEEPEGEAPGRLDKGKVDTLREEDLATVRSLNNTAVKLIRQLKIPLSTYDVPGGRDGDSDDSSQEV